MQQFLVNIMGFITGLVLFILFGRSEFAIMHLQDHLFTLWGLALMLGTMPLLMNDLDNHIFRISPDF